MLSHALGCETAQAHVGLGSSELPLPKGQMNCPEAQEELKSNPVALCCIISASSSVFLFPLSSLYNGSIHVKPSYNRGNRDVLRQKQQLSFSPGFPNCL